MTLKDYMQKTALSLGFTGYDLFLYRAANDWLVEEGYLASREEANSGRPIVTPKGVAAGLRETRSSENDHANILCSENFQGFLQESLDKIMAFERGLWQPFLNCLTSQWHARAHACCLEKEIPLTTLLQQINSLLPPDLPRKPNAIRVNPWLARRGLIKRVVIISRKAYSPTYEGIELGLGMGKDRKTIYWPFAAQQFLVDNLETIARDLASGEAYRLGPAPQRLTGAQEALSQIKFTAQERSLFDLTKMINQALAPLKEGAYKLPDGVIWTWLFREGYIKARQKSAAVIEGWDLTDAGSAAGFGRSEKGHFVAYEAGQSFVVAHLEEIWDLYLEI